MRFAAIHAGLVFALLVGQATAHGGIYIPPPGLPPKAPDGGLRNPGPGDTVPPGGPKTPGPSRPASPSSPGPTAPGRSPTTPAPSGPPGPMTGGAAGPGRAGPAAGPRTPGGAALEIDYTRWVHWWEYNRDRYLRLRDAAGPLGIASGSDEMFLGAALLPEAPRERRATKDDIEGHILPRLDQVLATSDHREVQTATLIALAKCSRGRDDALLVHHARRLLQDHDQEVRETAALSLGVARSRSSIALLEGLLRDDREGRRAVGRSEVDERMRAFAAYALGLIAEKSEAKTKLRVLATLQNALEDPLTTSREIKVALVTAMRIADVRKLGDATEKLALWRSLDSLERYYRAELGRGEQWLQAHVPTTIAALVGNTANDDRERFVAVFVEDLAGGKKRAEAIQQSAALALATMATPGDSRTIAALIAAGKAANDPQTRFFSILALGQIGGATCRDELLRILVAGRMLERPWAAVALGVLEHERRRQGEAPDETVGRELVKIVEEEKNPDLLGAAVTALGLSGYRPASERLLALLATERQRDEIVTHVCIALALSGETRAVEPLREVLATSVRRPELFRSAAIALGKLGDPRTHGLLVGALAQADTSAVRLSALAQALGFLGDRRAIDALLAVVTNPKVTAYSRAFAIAALGGIADGEDLPWNASLGKNVNYRATVATLIDHAAGVLDIL